MYLVYSKKKFLYLPDPPTQQVVTNKLLFSPSFALASLLQVSARYFFNPFSQQTLRGVIDWNLVNNCTKVQDVLSLNWLGFAVLNRNKKYKWSLVTEVSS